MGERWYVVQCHPKAERMVYQALVGDDIEAFLPEYLRPRPRPHRGPYRGGKAPTPLFPCYLFVRFDVNDSEYWKPINREHGVVRVLCSAEEKPQPVPDHIVAELQNSVGADGYIQVTDETKPIRYRPGQWLRIMGGSFQGFIGLYVGSDSQRVGILLEILGGKREVKVPEADIVLAEKPKGLGPRGGLVKPPSRHPYKRRVQTVDT